MEMMYKVGDKVRVRQDLEVGKTYGDEKGLSDCFCTKGMTINRGEVVEITNVDKTYCRYKVKGNSQYWTCDMFEGLASECEKPNKTQKFKVGDLIKGLPKSDKRYNYSNSRMTLAKVIELFDDSVMAIEVLKHTDSSEIGFRYTVTNDNTLFELVEEACVSKVVIYCKGRDVIAKNVETGKTAKATCHPDDPFDFNIGAKLAFERLMGTTPNPTKTEIKEVIEEERKAKIGEYIKITDATLSFGYYANGDIIRVTNYYDAFGGLKKVEGVNLRTNLKTCAINDDEYVVLTGYKPKDEAPKKEEPKLYNGKVVCVDNTANRTTLTVGKIYEFVDGRFKDNKDQLRPYFSAVHSLDEFYETGCLAKFIEVVE